jgi:hypothetical protein
LRKEKEMANPAREHEALLRRHGFVLVSENKHRKYKDPEGRVYIVSKTPSDWRAWRNAVATLKRAIANAVPSSELLEEERQRRELEASIALEAQRKPSVVGISGAGKGTKSRGTGFVYDDRKPPKVMPASKQRQSPDMTVEETERTLRDAVRKWGFSEEAAESVFIYPQDERWKVGLRGCPGNEVLALVSLLKRYGLMKYPVMTSCMDGAA